jgi:signal transduction histidine kinase
MRHNARLLIESELGMGSVFTIQFPESAAPRKSADQITT